MNPEEVTFQDLLAVMGPHSTNLSVNPDFFNRVLAQLYQRFHLELNNIQEAYDCIKLSMPGIGADFRRETASIDRKTLIRKLSRLSKSTRATIQAIEPFTGGTAIWRDKSTTYADDPVTYSHYFTEAVTMVHDIDLHPVEVDSRLRDAIAQLQQITEYADSVLVGLEELPSKQGQRGLGWYDHFINVMVEAATLLGVPISTRDRGSKDHGGTPFTAFVLEFESLFPRKAHSPSRAACAKRINRSLGRLRKTQNRA